MSSFPRINLNRWCFKSCDFGEKVFEEMGASVTWLVPDSQINMMEPILVVLEAGGETSPHDPHEGEEFGYVIKGSITVCIGKKKHKVKSNESFLL